MSLYRTHRHDWFITSTEEGYAWARCQCGHERLLVGSKVHGRPHPESEWKTPYLWNPLPVDRNENRNRKIPRDKA